jgi:hypothetical protein
MGAFRIKAPIIHLGFCRFHKQNRLTGNPMKLMKKSQAKIEYPAASNGESIGAVLKKTKKRNMTKDAQLRVTRDRPSSLLMLHVETASVLKIPLIRFNLVIP